MSTRSWCTVCVLGLWVTAFAADAWGQAPEGPADRPGRMKQRLLEKYDKDGDGQLGPEERRAVQQDVRDGKLEVPAWLRERWQQRGRGPGARPGGPRGERPGGFGGPGPGMVREKVEIEQDVEYGKAGERPLKLDVIKPKEPKSAALPVVVFIHGGGWRAGDKRGGTGRLAPLVATGEYVGVSVGYRLSGEATWPAQIHDCKAAIRWVRANAEKLGADPNRIGVWGGSAGGHLVNMLGASGDVTELEGECGSPDESSRVSCVVAFCGPANFRAPKEFEGGRRPSAVDQLLGGKIEEHEDLARQASPITYATDDDPPFLLVHGDADPIVPYEQAEMFRDALKKAGVDVTLLTVKGGGHGVGGPEVIRRVNLFFDRHLRGQDVEVSDEPVEQRPFARPQGRPGGPPQGRPPREGGPRRPGGPGFGQRRPPNAGPPPVELPAREPQ